MTTAPPPSRANAVAHPDIYDRSTIQAIDARLDVELAHEVAFDNDYLAVGGDTGEVGHCKLSPTVWDFVDDDLHDIVILYGPRREGKTVGGIARLIRVAQQYPEAQPIPVACVRDTWMNLSRTLIKTLKEGHKAGWWEVEFKNQETEAILNGGEVHMTFFGMDRPADANKFQGFETAILWIEEPAPAADLASGVPADVFGIGVSSLSYRGCKCSVQITMNPPDEDHWTIKITEKLMEMGLETFTVETYWIPPGENQHLPKGYRERMRLALELTGRFDLVHRLVEGQVFQVVDGVAVSPEFILRGPGQHVWDPELFGKPMEMNPRWDSYRFWDGALNPTCVWAQISPAGYMNVLGCLVGMNKGMQQFLNDDVLLWQSKRGMNTAQKTVQTTWGRPVRAGWKFKDIGDSSMIERDKGNSNSSSKLVLEAILRTSLTLAPVEWAARRDSIRYVLNQWRGGTRMLQIVDGDDAKPLVDALKGLWRYHRSSSGIVSRLPIKDRHSHPGDAFGYGCSVLFPADEFLERPMNETPPPPRPPIRPRSWVGA